MDRIASPFSLSCPMLPLGLVLISFNLEKNHSAVALSHVMSETIAGQCTPHRRWMLQSKLRPVYFPNTIAKVSNSTVKSNTLLVKYIYVPNGVCVCVRVLHFFFAKGGPLTCPGPGACGSLIHPCLGDSSPSHCACSDTNG